jgi:exopolysaccharide biosynthesis protein
LLAAFTLYIILDTFVISRVYYQDTTEVNTGVFNNEASDTAEDDGIYEPAIYMYEETAATAPTVVATAPTVATTATADEEIGCYSDENISVTIEEYTYNDTRVYVADVKLNSAEYLKTAFADDAYGKNIKATTSEMAEDNDAILAINGDNYGSRESGYVIRNGIVYRDKAGSLDVLCIYADGSMEIIDPDEISTDELVERGVWQAFSFGPALIEDGSVSVSEGDEVGKAKASNPRTAVGIIDDLHYVFVVSDGRTEESEGLSLYELAGFMESLGVTTAYNLDGGGSSTMVFQGTVINNPTTTGRSVKEREVNDIVYIG